MKNTRNLILIVEDDEKLRQTLEDFLTANHFAVLTAVDGEQALTLYYANNHLIDLILRDLRLSLFIFKSKLHLCLCQSDPESSPGAEFHIL